VDAIAEVPKKPSRQQRRKEVKSQQEKEREDRINEERAKAPKPGQQEMLALVGKLKGLGRGVREIPSDGNCLYRAISDQLTHAHMTPLSSEELRMITAKYLRTHVDDFYPFVEEPFNTPGIFIPPSHPLLVVARWIHGVLQSN
jgi:OTU domain-containing protein 6